MIAGEFAPGTQITFVKLRDKFYNTNGQHTLNAIVIANRPIQLSVRTLVASTPEEVAEQYAREDNIMPRTAADTLSAHGFAKTYDLSTAQVNAISAGTIAIASGFMNGRTRHGKMPTSERAKLFNQYAHAGQLFFEAVQGCPSMAMKELKVASVLGVGLVTFTNNPAQAKEFWSQVAMNDGLKVGDPRKTLMNWLLSNPDRSNKAQRARIAAMAWNGFLGGSQMSRFKVQDWTAPIKIFTGDEA
jgi:hypothetical protein